MVLEPLCISLWTSVSFTSATCTAMSIAAAIPTDALRKYCMYVRTTRGLRGIHTVRMYVSCFHASDRICSLLPM